MRPYALCLTSVLALAACKSRRQAEVKGIWIAQADGLSKAGKGETLAITRGLELSALPESQHLRLAVARDVEWAQIRALRKQVLDAGKTPHLLVASGRKVGALELYETLEGEAIDVFVSVGGKLCVAPPSSPEAKCVQRGDKLHVDRAFTRELVREAVKAWGLHDVLVEVPPDLEWADVARAIDGARTCCYEDKVRVRLK